MMSETTLLESRVDKIERDNRRLKLTVGALLLALAAVPLIGAVMPEQVPELIRAKNFVVEDENGTIRAMLSANGIGYHDENGNPRTLLSANGIGYHDENGTLRFFMDADGIGHLDENGIFRAVMGSDGIRYRDENGDIVWSTSCAPNC